MINFREIYNNIKDKDMLLIWAVALVLFIILVIVSVILSANKGTPTTKPSDIKLVTSQFDTPNSSFTIDSSAISSMKLSSQSYIYKTSAPDISENLKSWLSSLGKSLTSFECDELFCKWSDTTSKEVLVYSKISGSLSFSIKLLDKIDDNNAAISKSEALVKTITGKDITFVDPYKPKLVGAGYTEGQARYYFYREDETLPIWGDFDLATGNYISVNKNNEVIDATFQLLDLIKTDRIPTNLVSGIQVAQSINSFGQKYFANEDTFVEAYNSVYSANPLTFNEDSVATLNSFVPSKCKATDLKLGVRASTSENGDILYIPSYKFDCTFTYTINKKDFEIPGVTIAVAY